MKGPKPATHCRDCGEELTPLNKVYFQGGRYRNRCHSCNNKYQADLQRGRPRLRVAKYGISLEQYHEAARAQGGVCAICHRSDGKLLCVDHDHSTGEFRGLLCSDCNIALGYVHESLTTLLEMVEYLRKYQEKHHSIPNLSIMRKDA